MKKIWDEIGAFPVTEQGLADRARQIQTNKWLADIEIEELERNWNKKNSTVEVQENDLEITEHNENKQGQSEEQRTQEILVEQGHENQQQQKTPHLFISRRW